MKLAEAIAAANLNKLLAEENIVFLSENKKRTKAWLQALGRSTPFGGTKFGSIRMLSFADKVVNSSVQPFRGQQALTPLGPEQTTSSLVVMI